MWCDNASRDCDHRNGPAVCVTAKSRLAGCLQDVNPYAGILPDDTLIAACKTRYKLDLDVVFMSPPPISGDLWGLLPIDDGHLAIFCADVCGHGNAVAPHTRLVHTLLHLQPQNLTFPIEVLSELNRNLYRLLPRGSFATMFYGVIDFALNQLDYACSTFMPQLCRSDLTADFSCINGEGFPLGFLPEAKYELHSCRFAAGAGLVIYSDALVETPLPPHAIFTPNTLCNLMNENLSDMSAYEVNSNLIGRLNLNQNTLHDDLTLITLFRKA